MRGPRAFAKSIWWMTKLGSPLCFSQVTTRSIVSLTSFTPRSASLPVELQQVFFFFFFQSVDNRSCAETAGALNPQRWAFLSGELHLPTPIGAPQLGRSIDKPL